MSDFWKKTILYIVIVIVLLVVMVARNSDKPIAVKVEDGAAINKSTCINAFNSLKAARFQKKMLDQQVLLSAAAGRGEEALAVGVQVNELKAIATIFEKLIDDPKLDCGKYLKDEPKVTRKTI